MRANFVFSEVGIGLRRNLTMTIAVIISVAVSLGLFGVGLLIRQQVGSMKNYWYDKVEVSIFLCGKTDRSASCPGEVTAAERNAIRADLVAQQGPSGLIAQFFYEDHNQAFQHFKEQQKDSEIAQNLTPDQLPESFRVKLKDPTKFAVIETQFSGRRGVFEVIDQREVLERFFQVLRSFELMALFLAVTMLTVAVMLITNTMRVAAFSRRRETSIMRLVGASNLFIQLPFIVEAAIAGLLGGLLAALSIVGLHVFLIDGYLRETYPDSSFIGWTEVLTTVPVLLGTGVLLAALASFVSLRKYLRV